MRLNETNKLSSAVRLALAMGSAATMGAVGTAQAQNADAGNAKSQNLETIVVTGSNIRRVDMETASPVVTIDRAQIQQSGKLTLGDLVQQLPSMAGAATNPQVNNGGGTGASGVSLRGLGTQRTLFLVNGHRIVLQDLNVVPANAVERIEVLTDGASAVYGSDAVGGVVNFILRSNYQGAEFGLDYGISDHDDGQRKGYHVTFGQSTDKGSIMVGLNYNKNEPVMAKNRDFSKDAIYLYYGQVVKRGSSRAATGRVDIPRAQQPGGLAPLKCNSFTLADQSAGKGSSLADYRCYHGSNPDGSLADAFNFQAVGNYDLTPGERTGLFVLGSYKLTDHIEAYIEAFHSKTRSRTQIAPVPFDSQTDVNISKDNYYNPFGVDFLLGSGIRYRERLESLGNRTTAFGTNLDQLNTGFKGSFGDTGWNWDVNFTYGHRSRDDYFFNYMNYSLVAGGFGPSYKDASGAIVCGTDPAKGGSGPIANCTPFNIFNQKDPATIAALSKGKSSYLNHKMSQVKEFDAGVNGNVFELPAGSLALAGGVSYRKQYLNNTQDSQLTATPESFYVSCPAGSSICGYPSQGGFNVKEAYAELLVPVLKDMPFVHSLNIDLGTRYSKYSNFGSTNNWKVAIEFKPIEDLLLRGTVSQVFRAPTLTDIYAGPGASNPPLADPCNNLTAKNDACRGVPVGTGWTTTATGQTTAIVSGSKFINYPIKPEQGKSFDYGFVYDPNWLPGLSISGDLYRVTLKNVIISGDANYVVNTCFKNSILNGGGSGGPLCDYVHRTSTGDVFFVQAGTLNAGSLETKGADVAASYRLPETAIGNFVVGLKASYIAKYDITTVGVQHYAGHFDKTLGNYSRWRALANIDWNMGPLSASWQSRYVGRFKIGYPSPELGGSADGGGGYCQTGCGADNPTFLPVVKFGSYMTHNLSVGYNIEPLNTTVRVGVDNVFDKKPPIMFFNNTINANTDASTYDLIGRYFFGSVNVKF